MPRSPVTGEAPLEPRYLPNATVVRNVTLGTLTNEIHVDAMIDTGSTFCVVPPIFARALRFDHANRLHRRPVNVVGSQVQMDMHRLEYVKVGSAKAYGVIFGVHNAFPDSRVMLVGLTLIRQFNTLTFDFGENRVLFRSRDS